MDGTLIRSKGQDANKLHKEAFSYAFKEVFDVDTHIDVVSHHGSTDPLILVKVMEFHGVPKETCMRRIPDMQRAMVEYFMEREANAAVGLEVLPGVVELLRALMGRQGVHVGLCTGNLEPIAWAKMKALGLNAFFTEPRCGGFGSDYCSGDTEESWKDRAELVRKAAVRASSVYGGVSMDARFHVGDAPMDVQAAWDAGAVPVGVLTGIYTRQQLSSACPASVILDDLSDLDQVLSVLNLAG